MKFAFLLSLALLFAVGANAWAVNPVVVMETADGPIKIELFEDQAPVTVKNFLSYVDDKFYDGTVFHRVMKDFMIQGGGFNPGMHEKETKRPIKNESGNGLSNLRGTVAMARTNDPDSATAQFFINVVDNSKTLDPRSGSAGYAVFGRVIEGMDTVDKIRNVKVSSKGGHESVPEKDVVIKSARRQTK
ncbi:MAG: peptidylprolyl isomerase [Gemmataceae bacterium]